MRLRLPIIIVVEVELSFIPRGEQGATWNFSVATFFSASVAFVNLSGCVLRD